jgi:hypothetical protein
MWRYENKKKGWMQVFKETNASRTAIWNRLIGQNSRVLTLPSPLAAEQTRRHKTVARVERWQSERDRQRSLFCENSHRNRIDGEVSKQNEKQRMDAAANLQRQALPQWSEAKQFEYHTKSSWTTVNFFPVCFVATEFVLSDYSETPPPLPFPSPTMNWPPSPLPVYCTVFPEVSTHLSYITKHIRNVTW